MQSKSATLQEELNKLDYQIQNRVNEDGSQANDAQLNLMEMTRTEKRKELDLILAEEAQQQTLQERVEQAKETGYLLDTLYSNGIPLIELSHTPENHELMAIAVQKAFLAQQDAFNRELEEANEARLKAVMQVLEKIEERDEWSQRCKQAELEKHDSYKKLENAAQIMTDQADEIKKLKEQLTSEAVEIAPLSAEERETKLLAELNGNRTKVTNIRLKDTDGFDTRISLANNALTGDQVEFHTIYIKRYEEISEEAAEQLRADYANKKAELELQNTIIPIAPLVEPTIEPVNLVTEQEENAENIPTKSNQVDAYTNGEDQTADRNESLEQVVAKEESEVITLESLKSELDALKSAHDLTAITVARIAEKANLPIAS